ncbi:MAG: CotH kinase family protein [Bacilli bacterium]
MRKFPLIFLSALLLSSCTLSFIDSSSLSNSENNNESSEENEHSSSLNDSSSGDISSENSSTSIPSSYNPDLTLEKLFDPNSVVKIVLDFSNEALYKLAEYGVDSSFSKQEMYHPCQLSVQVNNTTVIYNDVGARMKGNTSRNNDFIDQNGNFLNREELCHFKIAVDKPFNSPDINDYYQLEYSDIQIEKIESRRVNTLKKFDLKWNRNYDQSFTKELYSLKCFSDVGVVSQLANLVSLTINTETDSVTMPYLLYQTVDKAMMKLAFPEGSKGDLYKCTYTDRGPADLREVDMNKIGVESEGFSPSYDLKTNEDTSDFSSLTNFINSTSLTYVEESKIKTNIENCLDVDYFLRFAAMSWVVGSPDDYRNNYNNYYLYFNSNNNKAYFIPYDNDRVFGILKGWSIDTSTQSMDSDRLTGTITENGCGMPLVRRLLVCGSSSRPIIESYEEKYFAYCKQYANEYLDNDKFVAFTNQFYYSSKNVSEENENLTFQQYAENKLATINL